MRWVYVFVIVKVQVAQFLFEILELHVELGFFAVEIVHNLVD